MSLHKSLHSHDARQLAGLLGQSSLKTARPPLNLPEAAEMIRINNTQYFHFLQQADALRRSGSLCDAVISVQSQTFRAHRLVLACASRMLAQHLSQGDLDMPVHCTLEHFSPHTFEQVLNFTYTQTLDVPVKDLHQLLRAARLLEMDSLEDQCSKQLDSLEAKDTDKKKAEYAEGLTANHQILRESPVSGDQSVEKMSSPEQDEDLSVVKDSLSPSRSPFAQNPPKPPRKRMRLSPMSAAFCNRESLLTGPTTSTSSFPPWAFSANVWDSGAHLNTLRRLVENYPNLLAAHPLPASHQSPMSRPFSMPHPHMFPLLSSAFQNPLQSSPPGYSHFHPSHRQNLYTVPSRLIFKHGLLRRNKLSQTISGGEASYPEENKVRRRAEDCQNCSERLATGPVLRESTSMQLANGCAGCQFCGSEVTQQGVEARGEHRGEKPYQCKHCPKKFSLKHQLDTHHRVHTGEKPFECRLCGQRSRDYSAMIKHLRTHGGAAPYQCTVCLEFCSSLVAMQRHIKSHAVQDFPPDWSISNTYLYISHI